MSLSPAPALRGLCSLCMCSKTTSKIQCVIFKNIYEACSLAPSKIRLWPLPSLRLLDCGSVAKRWNCGRSIVGSKPSITWSFYFCGFFGFNILNSTFLACSSCSKPAARLGIPPRLIFNLVFLSVVFGALVKRNSESGGRRRAQALDHIYALIYSGSFWRRKKKVSCEKRLSRYFMPWKGDL